MKNLLNNIKEKIKSCWDSSWKFIFKHETTVYISLGLSCLFLSYIFINNIKHTAELYKVKTEILLIEIDAPMV